MDFPPSVRLEAGDGKTGPFYLIIGNVPEGTIWHHMKDFVKSQSDRWVDMYVNLHGVRMDSGWIRVVGYLAFRRVEKIFRQNIFRGRRLLVHNPGYREGPASVLIKDPFFKDLDLVIQSVPDRTGMHPASDPVPASHPAFPTHPAPIYAAPPPWSPVPNSHHWLMEFPPQHPPPNLFFPPEQALYPPGQGFYLPERALYPPERFLYPPERVLYPPGWGFYPPEQVIHLPQQMYYRPDRQYTQYWHPDPEYWHPDPGMSWGGSSDPRTSAGSVHIDPPGMNWGISSDPRMSAGSMHNNPGMNWGRNHDPRTSAGSMHNNSRMNGGRNHDPRTPAGSMHNNPKMNWAGTMPIDSRRSSTSDAEGPSCASSSGSTPVHTYGRPESPTGTLPRNAPIIVNGSSDRPSTPPTSGV